VGILASDFFPRPFTPDRSDNVCAHVGRAGPSAGNVEQVDGVSNLGIGDGDVDDGEVLADAVAHKDAAAIDEAAQPQIDGLRVAVGEVGGAVGWGEAGRSCGRQAMSCHAKATIEGLQPVALQSCFDQCLSLYVFKRHLRGRYLVQYINHERVSTRHYSICSSLQCEGRGASGCEAAIARNSASTIFA